MGVIHSVVVSDGAEWVPAEFTPDGKLYVPGDDGLMCLLDDEEMVATGARPYDVGSFEKADGGRVYFSVDGDVTYWFLPDGSVRRESCSRNARRQFQKP